MWKIPSNILEALPLSIFSSPFSEKYPFHVKKKITSKTKFLNLSLNLQQIPFLSEFNREAEHNEAEGRMINQIKIITYKEKMDVINFYIVQI